MQFKGLYVQYPMKQTEENFFKEFIMIFRALRDASVQRNLPTPNTQDIAHDLKQFVERWRVLMVKTSQYYQRKL